MVSTGLRDVIAGYRDDYPVSSPAGRFPASPLGLFDGGGNVSEWMLDLYRTYTGIQEKYLPNYRVSEETMGGGLDNP